MSAYTIDTSATPSVCLPTELVGHPDLEEYTCIGDQWQKFINTKTGEIHDGAKYFDDWLRLQLQEG